MEGPYTIDDALRRASSLAYIWQFPRVVTSLQERSLWRDEWGALAEFAGYN